MQELFLISFILSVRFVQCIFVGCVILPCMTPNQHGYCLLSGMFLSDSPHQRWQQQSFCCYYLATLHSNLRVFRISLFVVLNVFVQIQILTICFQVGNHFHFILPNSVTNFEYCQRIPFKYSNKKKKQEEKLLKIVCNSCASKYQIWFHPL